MQQAMGSTLGSAHRCIAPSQRQPSRSTQATSALPPRAAPYALDGTAYTSCSVPALKRSGLRDSAISVTGPARPLACCAVASIPKPATAGAWGHPQSKQSRSEVAASASGSALLLPKSLAPRLGARRRVRVLPLPMPRATAAEAETEDFQVSYTLDSGLEVNIRKIRTLDELRQVATLRAEAYYAENHSRFVGSLKKKFVEQEVESLQQRTTITSRQGKPYSECLVAVDSASGAVLGCIDMRLPAALNGTHPHGVPQDDPHGCYLLNVVVREDVRGQGLGRAVMRAAMSRVVHLWGAQQLYTHVEADNKVAYSLYCGCGFAPHSLDSKYEAASKLGQTILLKAPASAAQP